MDQRPERIVSAFNDCINRRDIDGLCALMTDRHVFIDSANQAISGRARCRDAWKDFFAAFPDYRNHFESVRSIGRTVVVVGRSVCSDKRLEGAALWSATIEGSLVAEWRVYEDTVDNRRRLGVED